MILTVPTVLVSLVFFVVGILVGYIFRGNSEYDHGYAKGQLNTALEITARMHQAEKNHV